MNFIAPATDGFPIPPELTVAEQRIFDTLTYLDALMHVADKRGRILMSRKELERIWNLLTGTETMASMVEEHDKKEEESDRYWNQTWYRRLIRRFFPAQ